MRAYREKMSKEQAGLSRPTRWQKDICQPDAIVLYFITTLPAHPCLLSNHGHSVSVVHNSAFTASDF